MNDNFLPANIPGFASETTLVNGVRIHYWVGGNPNGLPVLLWHGFLGTSYVWNRVMPILAAAGYAARLYASARLFLEDFNPATGVTIKMFVTVIRIAQGLFVRAFSK